MTDIRKFSVTDTDANLRLDKFLSNQMPEFSRSEIQRMEITLNNAPAKLGARLRVGDVVSVVIPEKTSDVAADNISHDFDLDILFEDDDIIVINKSM